MIQNNQLVVIVTGASNGLGIEISKFASSCIDISDGIAKDLKNIAISSKKGFSVDIEQIPTRPKFDKFITSKYKEECILGGGEDYELCFTADNKYSNKISSISNKLKLDITKICDVKSSSFFPKPKIDSSVLFFKPKLDFFSIKDPKNLEKITRIFFMHRRKMLKKPYNYFFNGNINVANKLKINLNLRPQNLNFETYYKLTEEYENLRG